MHMVNWILILTLYVYLTSSNFAGKYYMTFRGMEKCPNPEEYSTQLATKVRKFNRTHFAYKTDLNMTYGVDDSMSVNFNVAKKGNGGFKDNFYFAQYEKVCTVGHKLAPHILARMAKFLKRDNACPLPPGKYNGTDYMIPVRYTNEDFPVAPYGQFRVQAIVVKHYEDGREEKLFCVRIFIDSVPAN